MYVFIVTIKDYSILSQTAYKELTEIYSKMMNEQSASSKIVHCVLLQLIKYGAIKTYKGPIVVIF